MTTVAGRDEFKNTPCPLEPLIKANGGRKKTGQTPVKKAKKRSTLQSGKGKGKRAISDDESEAELSDDDSEEE